VREGRTPESAGEAIVSSRLLVLQSKRLLLASTENCLVKPGPEELNERAGLLRTQTESAQHAYNAALLRYGSPERPDYWVVAYTRLIEKGNALITKLKSGAQSLPQSERHQLASELEVLEDAVGQWREEMRASMAAATA
jgi:hypothetical protein